MQPSGLFHISVGLLVVYYVTLAFSVGMLIYMIYDWCRGKQKRETRSESFYRTTSRLESFVSNVPSEADIEADNEI